MPNFTFDRTAGSHSLAAAGQRFREYAEAGLLLNFGASRKAINQRAVMYIDKILKGSRPADLPVEQPSTFELIINLKTARALDLTIPQSVLVRADEVLR